ncbi:MAG: acyl carrier protein [Candidatus Sedimenticola endophacoides]
MKLEKISSADRTRTEIAGRIAVVVSALLKEHNPDSTPVINTDASFQSFGLDSIQMVEIVARLEEEFGLPLEPELAFNYPTVGSLAGYIGQRQSEPGHT